MTDNNVQIHFYSKTKAKQIAQRLNRYNPLVKDWTAEDDGIGFADPLYAVFLTIPENEISSSLALTEIMAVVKSINVSVYAFDTLLVKSKKPTTPEKHCLITEISINECQQIFPFRKYHPHAEKLCCSDCNNLEWYSLPSTFEKARRECPYCAIEKQLMR